MKLLLQIFIATTLFLASSSAAKAQPVSEIVSDIKSYFGTASFYADKFSGRKTANGDSYDPQKFTAACNVLPLGTWIKVTNLRNNKSIIVRINDRLHANMNRLVDLSKVAAQQLGYMQRGLAKVKVEVLGLKRPIGGDLLSKQED
jgi:rare lipoprotein A